MTVNKHFQLDSLLMPFPGWVRFGFFYRNLVCEDWKLQDHSQMMKDMSTMMGEEGLRQGVLEGIHRDKSAVLS